MLTFQPRRFLMLALAAIVLTTAAATGASASSWLKFRADLFGDASLSGHAVYRERERDGGLERRFAAKVEHAVPGSTFDILVDGFFAGTATANSLGVAKLQLRTPVEPGEDWDPMPAGFPMIDSGSAVVVEHLSGLMFDQSEDRFRDRQRIRLRSDLEGPGPMDGHVRYLERFKRGRLMRQFKVEVEDGDEGTVLDIRVNGVFVGSLVVGADDEAEFQLRTAAFIDDPDDGEPMPDDFPTILAGDVVTVGPLQAILEID